MCTYMQSGMSAQRMHAFIVNRYLPYMNMEMFGLNKTIFKYLFLITNAEQEALKQNLTK